MVFNEKTRTAPTQLCGINAADVFSGLSPDSESKLARRRKSKRFAPGSSIFRNGDKPNFICILRSGKAMVVSDSEKRDETLSRAAEANEIFGLTECIVQSELIRGLNAVSDCECDLFDCVDIIHFLEAEPKVCLRLAKALGRSLVSGTF